MSEKEGGDSEKKMTKDFLDRWKKIASKYEGPEGEDPAKKAEKGKAPERVGEEDLDRFLAEIAKKSDAGEQKPSAKEEDELELDDLMADFGLEAEKHAAPERRAAEPKGQAAPTPPAAQSVAPPGPAKAEAAGDEAQKRVLDTLKKVGLVKQGVPEPSPPAAPKPEAEPADEEEEDTLMLELETLLSAEGPTAKPTPEGGRAAPAALEEEDLISELEGLLEGEGEEEAPHVPSPPPVRAPPALAAKALAPTAPIATEHEEEDEVEVIVDAVVPTPRVPIAEIKPPAAPIAAPLSSQEARSGQTNGGRVNGGRVNGGRVNGGRVNGGRVNGGQTNGGRVNGGRVNGGRVNGGQTNGGRVNGGRVNGGRVNGGRVNGGRVNGGRVNGGRVNGGRVNGGRVNGSSAPMVRAQNRRQTILSGLVAGLVVVLLITVIPFGGAPRGPAVDGDLSDWSGSGALFYTDAADSSAGLPPNIDLREYALRADSGRLWFEAQADGNLFSRPGPFPNKADHFILLVDVDGSAGTGYAYHDLGIDRLVDVYGWDGALKGSSTRAWANRPGVQTYDFSGFDTAGGLQLAVHGTTVEGTLTGLASGAGSAGIGNARAIFELRGVDSATAERSDTNFAPATLSGSAISATVAAVAPDQLAPNASVPTAMLSVAVANPSPSAAQVTGLRLSADYSPTPPADPATVSVWNDSNGNRIVDSSDTLLTTVPTALLQQSPAMFNFADPVSVPPGGQLDLLVAVNHVPSNAAQGTSLRINLASASDIQAGTTTFVTLVHGAVANNAQPLSYIGGAPSTIRIDGNTLDWANRSSVSDRASDAVDPHIDILSAAGNVSGVQTSFLVSFGASPLEGAVVPIRLSSTLSVPGGGGGGGGNPAPTPSNPGADFLWLQADTDNDTATGFASGGHGYDFAVRVDGKGGQVLPGDGAKFYRWDASPPGSWLLVPSATPLVGVGARALEISAPIPVQNLTARNITVTAYATDWQGVRDDLDQVLLVGNAQGSRVFIAPPSDGEGTLGEPHQGPLPIPEFQDIAVPAVGVLFIAGLSRRRARKFIA
jgi:hypothetical protein